ncbi:FAD/NAD(P)-binding domain-containing protein [Periconia macrospinosa]|uniref:FAD/NAD(P)-binding domain-containing protein n=1 Tax=Periconia macrospinosa TaxID=97972 RepID=A0A2V1DV14_9PLEO|nr:FAD/NAD(P)-binding domain-containing protein [Periconia macrospinosa]
MMAMPRIAIIGGGPGGLTLARLLQKHSVACTVFEKDQDRYACQRGGSLDLHPQSGQRALRKAGLWEEFNRHARREAETLRIFSPKGDKLLDESSGEGGRPEDFNDRPEVDRRVLRRILLDSLKKDTVKWNSKLSEIGETANGKLRLQFSNGREEDGFDVAVGADGAWSKVRSKLTEQKPLYSGIGGLECFISKAESRKPDLAERVGKGMCLTLGKERGIMAQTNSDGIQIYAFARIPEAWHTESGVDLTAPEAKQYVIDTLYSDWETTCKRLVLESDMETKARPLYMLPVDFEWPQNSQITLMGDAAHLMTPFAGVGVNVAMEDALELCGAIVEARDKGRPVAEALQEYEVKMWKRAHETAKLNMMYQGLFFHKRGGIAMVEHFEEEKLAEQGKA